MTQESKSKEFNEKFLGSYQQEQSDPTNKDHQFDSEKATADGQTTNPTTATPVAAQQLAASVTTPAVNLDLTAFGYPLVDFTNALLPNGAPVGSRHKSAIKLAYDLLVVCDGDAEKVRALLMQLQWVKDVVAERGQKEIDDIMESAQKLKHKRESENYYDLLPSKEMRRAIESVTGRKFTALVKEVQKQALGGMTEAEQQDITAMLERIGREIEKMFPYTTVHENPLTI